MVWASNSDKKGKRSVNGFVPIKQKLPSTNAPIPIKGRIHLFMIWIQFCHAHTSPGSVNCNVTICIPKIKIGQSGHQNSRDTKASVPKGSDRQLTPAGGHLRASHWLRGQTEELAAVIQHPPKDKTTDN